MKRVFLLCEQWMWKRIAIFTIRWNFGQTLRTWIIGRLARIRTKLDKDKA